MIKSCNTGQNSPKSNISRLALIPEWNAIKLMTRQERKRMGWLKKNSKAVNDKVVPVYTNKAYFSVMLSAPDSMEGKDTQPFLTCCCGRQQDGCGLLGKTDSGAKMGGPCRKWENTGGAGLILAELILFKLNGVHKIIFLLLCGYG